MTTAASLGPTEAPTRHGRPEAASAADPGLREYLSFRVGTEEYGIDILRVQEIRSYEAPTRLAGAPGHVTGVTNLRGNIVPILDLRRYLGSTDALIDAQTVTIVLNIGGRVIGTVVDAVSDVVGLSHEQIKPAPQLRHGLAQQAVVGIAPLECEQGSRLLILLDIDTLLGLPDAQQARS